MSKKESVKRVTVVLDEDLDYEFRRLASQKFRFEPKWYSKAIIEAISLWIDNNSENPSENLSDSSSNSYSKNYSNSSSNNESNDSFDNL